MFNFSYNDSYIAHIICALEVHIWIRKFIEMYYSCYVNNKHNDALIAIIMSRQKMLLCLETSSERLDVPVVAKGGLINSGTLRAL